MVSAGDGDGFSVTGSAFVTFSVDTGIMVGSRGVSVADPDPPITHVPTESSPGPHSSPDPDPKDSTIPSTSRRLRLLKSI